VYAFLFFTFSWSSSGLSNACSYTIHFDQVMYASYIAVSFWITHGIVDSVCLINNCYCRLHEYTLDKWFDYTLPYQFRECAWFVPSVLLYTLGLTIWVCLTLVKWFVYTLYGWFCEYAWFVWLKVAFVAWATRRRGTTFLKIIHLIQSVPR